MTLSQNPETTAGGSTADIFCRHRRASRRARLAGPRGTWFDDQMGVMLLERLGDLTRQFSNVLVIGARCRLLLRELGSVPATAGAQISIIEQSPQLAASSGASTGEEDRLPVAPGSFDCILWPGGLESINDVPGALMRCRLALVDDGLLLGCFPGDGSFPLLRRALQGTTTPKVVARMQPQIDTRSVGDLLSKVGMSLAVADSDRFMLAYESLSDLVADLRAAAWTNLMAGDTHPFTKQEFDQAARRFLNDRNEAGRVIEQLTMVHFSAWSPHADQPRPARRGSGTTSLAQALKRSASS